MHIYSSLVYFIVYASCPFQPSYYKSSLGSVPENLVIAYQRHTVSGLAIVHLLDGLLTTLFADIDGLHPTASGQYAIRYQSKD